MQVKISMTCMVSLHVVIVFVSCSYAAMQKYETGIENIGENFFYKLLDRSHSLPWMLQLLFQCFTPEVKPLEFEMGTLQDVT